VQQTKRGGETVTPILFYPVIYLPVWAGAACGRLPLPGTAQKRPPIWVAPDRSLPRFTRFKAARLCGTGRQPLKKELPSLTEGGLLRWKQNFQRGVGCFL